MIKLVFVIRRREDLSPEEFHRYWLEEHGPLARSLRRARRPALRADPYARPGLNTALAAARGTIEAYTRSSMGRPG
jgi:hypothetical protein